MESIMNESTILNGNIDEIIYQNEEAISQENNFDVENYYLEATCQEYPHESHNHYYNVEKHLYYNDQFDRSMARCCEQSNSKDTYKINDFSLEIEQQHDYLYVSPTRLNKYCNEVSLSSSSQEECNGNGELDSDVSYVLFMTNDYDLISKLQRGIQLFDETN
jgi:hypothetical protein